MQSQDLGMNRSSKPGRSLQTVTWHACWVQSEEPLQANSPEEEPLTDRLLCLGPSQAPAGLTWQSIMGGGVRGHQNAG